jgi:hypothetical protein
LHLPLICRPFARFSAAAIRGRGGVGGDDSRLWRQPLQSA